MRTTKVTVYELFCIYFLTIFVTVFLYMASSESNIGVTDTVIKSLLFMPINALVAIPLFLYIRKYREIGILENLATVSKPISNLFAVAYIAVFWIVLIRTGARFDLFVSTEMFPQTDMSFFLVIIIVVCALLCTLGFGSIGRSSAIFALLLVGSMMLIFFSVLEDVDLLNFTPPFLGGALTFINAGIKFAFFAIELGTIPLFLPEIKGDIKKGFGFFGIAMGITITAMTFIIVSTLGPYADTQLFPAFSVSTLGRYKMFDRLDTVETAVWMLCVITKMTFYFLCTVKCLKHLFPRFKKWLVLLLTAAPPTLILLWVSRDIEHFSFLSSSLQINISYITVVVLLPLLALFIFRRKEKKDEKAQAA